MRSLRTPLNKKLLLLLATGCFAISQPGCFNIFDMNRQKPAPTGEAGGMSVVELRPGSPRVLADRIEWRGAKNEWLDAFVQIPTAGANAKLTVEKLTGPSGQIDTGKWRVYRVENIVVDSTSVAAVRSEGPGAKQARLPRALIPIEELGGAWRIPTGTSLLYVELKVPIEVEAGDYAGAFSLDPGEGGDKVALGVKVAVDDIALSEAPGFSMFGEVRWDDVVRLWPKVFDGVEPRLLGRLEAKRVLAVERLDDIVRLARDHRVDVGFTKLQPTVKYSPASGLTVDWTEYDSLVLPWLEGEVDVGREGLTAFPLPVPDAVANGGIDAGEFETLAARHFEQRRLLGRMLIPRGMSPQVLQGAGSELAEKVRGMGEPVGVAAQSREGVRHVAWEAFASGVGAGHAGTVSPAGTSAENAGELRSVWFFPGEWFGTTGVVPSVELKWARRAQQDRQLFDLAQRRGAGQLAQRVAREATRYGETAPPVGGDLLVPRINERVWDEGLKIVRAAGVSRAPGGVSLNTGTGEEEDSIARWGAAVEVPVVIPSGVQYWVEDGRVHGKAEFELAEVGAEVTVVRPPDGWDEVGMTRGEGKLFVEGVLNSAGVRYPVTRETDVRGNPIPVNGMGKVEAVSGLDRVGSVREVIVPGAVVLPSPKAPVLDGEMGDWSQDEIIGDGPLVRMMDRAGVQASKLIKSASRTQVLARWDKDALYLAVRAEGVSSPSGTATNFVREEKGRGVGEDLVRVVIRPVTQGREVKLDLKPAGVVVETGGGEQVRYASRVEGGIWRAEMRIPASLLGKKELGAEEAVEFNLIRHDVATGESASWAGPVDEDWGRLRGILWLVERAPKVKPVME